VLGNRNRDKKIFKKVKKPLDKPSQVWYYKYRKREAGQPKEQKGSHR
jgi:hypothetical protein